MALLSSLRPAAAGCAPWPRRGLHVSLFAMCMLVGLSASVTLYGGEGRTRAFREYDVKAAFVYNFTQFVEWLSAAFPEPDTPFVIGVLGNDPFGGMLDALVDQETVKGRRLVVERYRTIEEIQRCHILFISRADASRARARLPELASRHILTVGDAEGFERQGGVIGFVSERDRIRVRINLEAARTADLTISSKLLRAAEVVDANMQGMLPWASRRSSEG
ncbi:MAG TPA: YfiR family protein [Opitutaceae bacterium]